MLCEECCTRDEQLVAFLLCRSKERNASGRTGGIAENSQVKVVGVQAKALH